MADTCSLNFLDFDDLFDSAVKGIDYEYFWKDLSSEEKEELKADALEKLPDNYQYKVEKFVATDPKKFKLCVTTEDISIEVIDRWLTEFEEANDVNLRVKVKKKQTKGYLIQNYYRCQHNTRHCSPKKDPQRRLETNPAARIKNTNYPFQLSIKIQSSNVCRVDMDWEHTHSIDNLEASNFKDLSSESIEKVKKLYEAGCTPSTARQQYLAELRVSCKDDIEFHIKKADRSTTPRRRDFRYIYEQFGQERFGGKSTAMFEKLIETLEDYKKSNPEANTDYQLYGGDNVPLLVAIVTPLMKRVHKHMKQSGELVFVDATSNTEEHNLKVFLLCTHSVAGALPCSILISSDEKESTLKSGFEKLKNCLPEDAFYGRGCSEGPTCMMTDNCDEERSALQFVWPSVKLLLCTFHVLQQVWRWLVDKNHQISQSDKLQILSMFKRALYAESEDVLECCYHELVNDMCEPYDNAIEYFEKLYEDRKDFAHCFHSGLILRGNQTNNFVESQFLVVKDVILKRTKEYNVVALFERLTIDLERHYQEKLLSIADGSFDGHFRRRFMGKAKSKKDGGQGFKQPSEAEKEAFLENVKTFSSDVFEVASLTDSENCHMVDMSIGVCSCEFGKDGSPCKHQYMIWATKLANSLNFVPIACPELRQSLALVALGKTLPMCKYTSLRDVESSVTFPANTTEEDEVGQSSMETNEVEASIVYPEQESAQRFSVDEEIDRRQQLIRNAKESIEQTCSLLLDKLESCKDSNLAEGALKFSCNLQRLMKSMSGNLTSALFNFGTAELHKSRNGKKIKVQPN